MTGTCKYCGQVRMVRYAEGKTQEDLDRIATSECDWGTEGTECPVRREQSPNGNRQSDSAEISTDCSDYDRSCSFCGKGNDYRAQDHPSERGKSDSEGFEKRRS